MKLKCPNSEFLPALRAVRRAASKDETRIHLNGIWIRALPDDRAHLWATNGHWLAVARLPGAQVEDAGSGLVLAADLPSVLAAAPKGKHLLGEVGIGLAGQRWSFDFGIGAHVQLRAAAESVSAPPAHDIVPAGRSPRKHERPSVSSGLLALALGAIDEMAPRAHRRCAPVRMVPTGKTALDPQIIWSPAAPDFFALLMPMRNEKKRDMGWWFDHVDAIRAALPKPEAPTQAAAE